MNDSSGERCDAAATQGRPGVLWARPPGAAYARPVRAAALRLLWAVAPIGVGAALLLAGGCASSTGFPTTQLATDIDPQQAEPGYWYDQPPVASAGAPDFDPLWDACERVARDYLFEIDRRDRRDGVMTTVPMVSAQFFEPWRRELSTFDDVAQSSVATVRRTIRFEVRKASAGKAATQSDGGAMGSAPVQSVPSTESTSPDGYVVTPYVLVERQTLAERRVTSVLPYRTYFRSDKNAFGTRETDRSVVLPSGYWYAIGRDKNLEERLAREIAARVNRSRRV